MHTATKSWTEHKRLNPWCTCSQLSPFVWWTQPCGLDLDRVQQQADASSSMTHSVERRRQQGEEPGSLGRLSKRTPNDPRQLSVFSLAQS